jgi:predicted metalloprotease with PDZ domain
MARVLIRSLAAVLFGLTLVASTAGATQPLDVPELPWSSPRGRIGAQVQPMTPELREHMGAPVDHGVLVVRIDANRPAARAGLEVGDVVIAVNGEPIQSASQLARRVRRAPEGAALQFETIRAGKRRTLSIQPEEPEDPWADPEEWMEQIERGLTRGSEELRKRLDELERRLKELEQRIENPPAKPEDETQT